MSRFRHLPDWQFARMTFALAGVALLALVCLVNCAQAGCGDYVFVRNASGQLVRASTLVKDHAAHGECRGPNCPGNNPPAMPTEAVPDPRAENPPLKLPCNGPNCSGESQLPAVPVPPPAPQRSSQESTALLLKLNDHDSDEGAGYLRASSSGEHELHYPESIFHPPR
ncbi:MAG: hypothetical protein K8R36_03655 [Planctomycetales bacterium]|nr:hypothetical protein [Planctomycetales bacterium]